MNEYNDWTSPSSSSLSTTFTGTSYPSYASSESEINRIDSLIDILGDALIIGPLTKATNLHFQHQQRRFLESSFHASSPNLSPSSSYPSSYPPSPSSNPSKTFFYVFSYQSESSKFTSRLGAIHGEELQYLFGAPIASSILASTSSPNSYSSLSSNSFFGSFSMAVNYSKAEVILSQNVIAYFTNFAKTGNPNLNSDPITPSKSELKSTSAPSQPAYTLSDSNLAHWPEYDTSQRRYLNIGLKSKVKDNYRTHRLSFWNNLVPKLQIHGMIESEKLRKHLNSLSADQYLDPKGTDSLISSFGSSSEHQKRAKDKVAVFERISLKFLNQLEKPSPNGQFTRGESNLQPTTPRPQVATSDVPKSISDGTNQKTSSAGKTMNSSPSNIRLSTTPNDDGYSTVLSMTIAIGLSLLILNILVFLGVYYKLHNHTVSKRQQQLRHAQSSNTGNNSNTLRNTHSLNRNGTLGKNNSNASGSIKRRSTSVINQVPGSVRNSMVHLPPNEQQQMLVGEQQLSMMATDEVGAGIMVEVDPSSSPGLPLPNSNDSSSRFTGHHAHIVNYVGHQQNQQGTVGAHLHQHHQTGYDQSGYGAATQQSMMGTQQSVGIMHTGGVGGQYQGQVSKHVHYSSVIPGVCLNTYGSSNSNDTSTTNGSSLNQQHINCGTGSMKRCHFADEIIVNDIDHSDDHLQPDAGGIMIVDSSDHLRGHQHSFNYQQSSRNQGLLGIASLNQHLHSNNDHSHLHHTHHYNNSGSYGSNCHSGSESSNSNDSDMIGIILNKHSQSSPSNNPNLTVISESDEHL